tara:strand:+ start:145 stop:768 length:624 start_codon:yes stop_codon:yes gene_type:complete
MNSVYTYFKTDSPENKLIHKCLNYSQKADGYVCIIGLSAGNIMEDILINLLKLRIRYRIIIAVDPYGSIPHYSSEKTIENNHKFSNDVRNYSVSKFYNKLQHYNLEGTYIQLDSSEFVKLYSEGIPFYCGEKIKFNKYSFVILSGNNNINDRIIEFEFFRERMDKGSIIIFTDTDRYPHVEKIHSYILSNNFEEFSRANSFIAYCKC